ncbi:MAG: M12 family metallo-peptidase [Pyrinomonadaceae bacterium]
MPRNSKLLVFLLAMLFVAASAFSLHLTRPSHAAQNAAVLVQSGKPYAQDVDKLLRRYDKLELDSAIVATQVKETGRIFLPTSAGGFDIALTPHDMRAARYRAQEVMDGGVIRELERGAARTYKGAIAGIPDGQARITVDSETFEGLIITPGQIYFIEPAKRYSAKAGPRDFVLYQQSDLLQGSLGECGVTTLAEKVSGEALRVESRTGNKLSTNGVIEELFSPPRTVDLATEADFEYFTFFTSATAANNEILSIMNQVEAIYDLHFGLQFTIVFQNVWSTASDPYTTTNASPALAEFTNYWNANHGSLNRDLVHMWTGKDFESSTIGIAWRPGLDCPLGQQGYGMSQRLGGTPGKFIVTAHEIGHNFDAQHSDAQAGCTNSIMNASLSGSTTQTFCAFSVSEIEARANLKVACLAQALTPGCTYSLSSFGQSVGSSGGSGSVNVNTVGTNCVWAANSAVSWIIVTSGNGGTNSGTVTFAVAPNTNGFARQGLIRIAEQNFIVSQPGAPGCNIVPISLGQTINGSLASNDCRSSQRENTYADQYSFSGTAGEQVSIALTSTGSTYDTYLYLLGPTGAVVAENDDIEGGVQLDSRIPVNGFFSLPVSGSYIIESTSYDPSITGAYTLSLTSGSPNTVQLTQATFNANEGAGRVDITMSRSGVIAGAASVNYATSDTAGLTNCNVVNGIASSRCDYAASVGTINFAAGEGSKSFSIPLVDDSYAEGTESFTLTLSSPSGSSLGSQATATATVTDNETSIGPNPIVGTAFFVRQHYIDFLGREPDPGGFAAWQNTINNCPGGDTSCDRVHVSGNFFQSPEFQARGYFVYRFYPVAFGRKPDYAEFIPDLARVSGFLSDAQLEAAKVALINEFMSRPAFAATFNGLSNTQYVDTLLARAGVTSPNRDFWIAALGNGTRTRATVLRDIVESLEVYNRYYNQAFVVMQYFGYLRRDPDASYLNWIDELNNTNNSRNMINGFVNSLEYRFRFGP